MADLSSIYMNSECRIASPVQTDTTGLPAALQPILAWFVNPGCSRTTNNTPRAPRRGTESHGSTVKLRHPLRTPRLTFRSHQPGDGGYGSYPRYRDSWPRPCRDRPCTGTDVPWHIVWIHMILILWGRRGGAGSHALQGVVVHDQTGRRPTTLVVGGMPQLLIPLMFNNNT